MNMCVKAKSICDLCSKKTLTAIFLLCMVVLISFPLLSVSSGESVVPDVVVGNEADLLNAIDAAPKRCLMLFVLVMMLLLVILLKFLRVKILPW
jgi:hypothetical protein